MSNVTSCVGSFLLKAAGSDLYATANNQFATLSPLAPNHQGQTWEGQCVPGVEGLVTITDKETGSGWTFTAPGEPVTLSKTPSRWYIDFVSKDSVTLHAVPARPMVGALWYAGADQDKVTLKAIPVVLHPPQPPVWQLINELD